jgi:hypothetical protein
MWQGSHLRELFHTTTNKHCIKPFGIAYGYAEDEENSIDLKYLHTNYQYPGSLETR